MQLFSNKQIWKKKSNSIFAEIGTHNTLKFLSLPFRQY